MRAVAEHLRIATTIGAELIGLALAGVGAGPPLAGARPIHTSETALCISDGHLARLHQQLQSPETPSAHLRSHVATLTAQLARARQSQLRAATGTHIKRRRPKRLISTVQHHRRHTCSPT